MHGAVGTVQSSYNCTPWKTPGYIFYVCSNFHEVSVICAQSLQSYLTFCNPKDHGPPGSSVHGIFPSKDTGSRLPCPHPGDLPDPGIKLVSLESPALQADSLPLRHEGSLVSGFLFQGSYHTASDGGFCYFHPNTQNSPTKIFPP